MELAAEVSFQLQPTPDRISEDTNLAPDGRWNLVPVLVRAARSIFALARKEQPLITLGFLAFLWAIVVPSLLFPYYSNDHDEPVYLFQARMLLEGKIYLVADEFTGFFQPFFFIDDGERVFPKYYPVHAGFLALGDLLFGSMRASMALVAALNVVVFYLFTLELYADRRFALKSAAFLLLSPFFLIQSTTFLPYSTSLMLSLTFGVLLLRGVRTSSTWYLVFSGLVLGMAFFHRPYDAVLFAAPFGIILLYRYWKNLGQLFQRCIWISVGFAPFLVLTLGYNAFLTGDPLLPPYLFHEPLDKLGFGIRRLNPTTPPVDYGLVEGIQALGSNVVQLLYWVFAGPVLLIGGIVGVLIPPFRWQKALLLLLLISFPLGYFFFWGTYNIVEIWGAVSYLGPFYYFSTLVPIVLLGTRGLEFVFPKKRSAAVTLVSLMCLLDLWLVFRHVAENYRYTEESRAIYEPFRQENLSDALVFVPPLYGPFVNHPFAFLENTPSLDGQILYAVDRGNQNFKLMDRYPDRQPYRFIYHGKYTEEPDVDVRTELVQLQRIATPELSQSLRIANPTDKPYVYAYVWNDERTETYLLDDSSNQGSVYDVHWSVTRQGLSFDAPVTVGCWSEIDFISANQPLVIAVAFADSPDRAAQVIFERRFLLQSTSENTLEFIYPPEEWHNSNWPTAEWLNEDISSVMRDREIDPQDFAATSGIGSGCLTAEAGRIQEIIETYDDAIGLDPSNAQALINRGNGYGAVGRFEEAIQNYDQAIRLDPSNADAFLYRGNAYGASGRFREAIQSYDQAIRLDPSNAEVFLHLGNAYGASGEFREAIQSYDEVVRLDPSNAEAFLHRGNAYGASGQFREAIRSYDEVVRLDPSNAEAFMHRGNALRASGRLQEAVQSYDQSILLGHEQALVYANRAVAFALLDYPVRTNQDVKRAVELGLDADIIRSMIGDTTSSLNAP